MPDTALACAGCFQLARWRSSDAVGELLHRLVGARARHLHARWVLVHERERRIAVGLELGEALPVHHRDFDGDDAERVAIGRRRGDRRMTNDARAAGAVDDIEGLLLLLLEHRRDDARGRIRSAAGSPWANDGDRPARPSLGARGPEAQCRNSARSPATDQEVAARGSSHDRVLPERLCREDTATRAKYTSPSSAAQTHGRATTSL